MRIITRGVPRSRTSYSKYLSNSPARHYSHSSNSSPKAFTFASQQKDGDALLSQLREKLGSANSESYDAAVVLGTPGLARLLANDSFIGGLSSSLLTLSSEKGTHVVTAAVDRLAPVGSVAVEEGISVLRGRVDDIMPGIWNAQAPRPKEDADTVSALTFGLSDGSITLPLARTVFYHQRVSTLVATCFQTSDTAALTVARQTEPRLAHINLPTSATMADASFQLPLIPLTHARKVLESFGNIVRGVEVGGKRTPGSTELEEIANKMYSLDNYAPEAGPMSIWALVTPGTETAETSQLVEPDPGEMFELLSSGKGLEQLTSRTSEYVAQRHRQGGRLYKLLSGGGGWGQKAGLLALDPQLTHFAQSDEEAMEKFLSFSQGHQHLGYVPPGSRIQFLAGAPPSVNFRSEGKEGYLFGVQRETSSVLDETNQDKLWLGRFGALSSSSSGIFLKNHGSSLSEPDSRITVPGSLLAISS